MYNIRDRHINDVRTFFRSSKRKHPQSNVLKLQITHNEGTWAGRNWVLEEKNHSFLLKRGEKKKNNKTELQLTLLWYYPVVFNSICCLHHNQLEERDF